MFIANNKYNRYKTGKVRGTGKTKEKNTAAMIL